MISDEKRRELDAVAALRGGMSKNEPTFEPQAHPMSDRHFQHEVLRRLDKQSERLDEIEKLLQKPFPTSIRFTEVTMNPTAAGQTQVFTGTLQPAGAVYPSDTTFTLTSNDSAVAPTVDSTGLIVSVTYPAGWVESTTTPLVFSYGAASVSTGGSLSATITPSAPAAAFPTGIKFNQTT